MSADPQLFKVNPTNKESEKIEGVDFSDLGLLERGDIQEWVASNPSILGDDLLVIGKEFSGFDKTNERLDLLAVDTEGKLVIIELKRDDSGADAHWQAIKYASYISRASARDVVRLLAGHKGLSESEAEVQLSEHLESAESLNALNSDQRIILVSRRFAPEVTSAVLWLNEKAPGEELITCIQLTPYRDASTDSLYIQANTIIPVPGSEEYVIGIGDSPNGNTIVARQSDTERRNDDITRFLRGVCQDAVSALSDEFKPDKNSRLAGTAPGGYRYYRMWYSRPPWANRTMCYGIRLYDRELNPSSRIFGTNESRFGAYCRFTYKKDRQGRHGDFSSEEADAFASKLSSLSVYDDQEIAEGTDRGVFVSRFSDTLDSSFAETLAHTLRKFIEEITPMVDEFEEDRNEEDA